MLFRSTVITTGSVIKPINGFGNPKSVDCQAFATFPQETTALISQANFEFGLPASFQASIDRTNDAMRLKVELISIATYVLRYANKRSEVMGRSLAQQQ